LRNSLALQLDYGLSLSLMQLPVKSHRGSWTIFSPNNHTSWRDFIWFYSDNK